MASEERHDPHGRTSKPENRPPPTAASAYRDISTQHRELTALLHECQMELNASAGESPSRELIRDLTESMEAHFGREESLYYPTLWALRPEVKASLKRLIGAHEDFRERLASIALDVQAGAITNAAVGLDQLARLFPEHEAAEERILDSLCPAGAARTGVPS
jgi:hypothetical protein